MRWMGLIFALLVLSWAALVHASNEGHGVVLEIDGPIGPATSEYVSQGIQQAEETDASLVLLEMDTPGGLDTAMREIIGEVLASEVPVVGYVAPRGSRAASAGTYILFATHVAAMAPATNLGAATPVQIGGLPTPGGEPEKPERGAGEEQEAPPASALEQKAKNDATAYIRGLAKLRGRNVEWAGRAVTEAASLHAEEALREGVIDVVADSRADLLAKLDGRVVTLDRGPVTLHTDGLALRQVEQTFRNRLLSVITNPNVAYLLLLLGIYGLFFELANPGFIAPGVIGGIALLLALFALQMLPVNYAGIALILLGTAFMIGEAFVPSFGALGIGGVIAFVFGSIMLFDEATGAYDVSLGLIVGLAAASVLFFVGVVGLAIRARRRPVVSGREELVGAVGVATEAFSGVGFVRAHGELWTARCDVPLHRGDRVRIRDVDGLRLRVEPDVRGSAS